MTTTEQARRHKLQKMGIGSSSSAVLARRSRETMNSVRTVEAGERLPWWVDVPEMATLENIQAYLGGIAQETS